MHTAQKKSHPAPQPRFQGLKKVLLFAEKWQLLLFFVFVWLWAFCYYGDVFYIARESSFWVANDTLMYFEQGIAWSWLWKIGRFVLMCCKWTAVAALVVAVLLTGITFFMDRILRLPSVWKWVNYLPAAAWLWVVAYLGFDVFFETETGRLFGLPLAVFVVLGIIAGIMAINRRNITPIQQTAQQHNPLWGACSGLLVVLVTVLITATLRPYVPVVTKMHRQVLQQDWKGAIATAVSHKTLSYRQMAAYYAIALVHTNQQCTNLFDIRMDYDEPYLHTYNNGENNGSNYYMEECDFHSGLILTCIHHAMEQMTMIQPSIRTLKILTKCALMRGEWEVAEKYFAILKRVPFESDFIEKYQPMVRRMDLVNADPEFAQIRLTEPIHNMLESQFIKPTFLGYTADLYEGRSMNALWNSLAVNMYSKRMDAFLMRCEPLIGTMPPTNVADALTCISTKHPEIMQQFPSLQFNKERFGSFLREVKPYISDRPRYAEELFPAYAGYYGYYYFFGNLKATKKSEPEQSSAKQGVN